MAMWQHDQTRVIGVLLSGAGSNFEAIAQAVEAGQIPQTRIGLVLSNRAAAMGLEKARQRGLPTLALSASDYPDRVAMDADMVHRLRTAGIHLVVLAGYNRIVTDALLTAYRDRLLNIHPSLLPAYGGPGMLGMAVHEAVIANREAESGCSVHRVTAVVDGGEILGQTRIPVLPDDTAASLADRVLAAEHQLYPVVIRQVLDILCPVA